LAAAREFCLDRSQSCRPGERFRILVPYSHELVMALCNSSTLQAQHRGWRIQG
jgi:hypothetical protein